MKQIVILSSSIRAGRKSHGVALYLKNYMAENSLADVEILDLKAYSFPLFEATLKTQSNPALNLIEFASKIKKAQGIIIVTPEYNGGIPASLKNAIDVLYDEWHGKPISIATVSSGAFGGAQVLVSLQFSLWKIGAWTVTNMFPVPNVSETFDEKGNVLDKAKTNKLTEAFIKEFLTCVELNQLPDNKALIEASH